MYERCILEAERLLAADKDVIVPVKKLWEEVSKEGRNLGFEVAALPDFTALLEGDSRFEFLPERSSLNEELEELPDAGGGDEDVMDFLGFHTGDRVKLRRIKLTPEIVGGIIRSKVDRTMEALNRAWEQRPEEDDETEGKLKEILEKARELQNDVRDAFSEDRMKQLSRALRESKPAGRPKKKAPSRRSAKRLPQRAAKRSTPVRKKPRRKR